MKRFYKTVTTRAEDGGHAVLLDGKPVKTAGRHLLLAPTAALAEALMREWAAQEKEIKPDEMPLTQILSTKIDRVSHERGAMTAMLMEYLETDLVRYRAPGPEEPAAMQAGAWDQWLDRFDEQFGVSLSTTTDLNALETDPRAVKAVADFLALFNDDLFTVLQLAASISGSLVLALFFVGGEMNAGEIFAAARVEERHKARLYNEEKYGPDPAQEKKDKAALADLTAAAEYLSLLEI